ncbi:MAG: cytochrome b/b6 domain-containing protein [Actinomycetota bacterium]
MADRMPRRGLPRVPGGDPWPPAVEIATASEDHSVPAHREPEAAVESTATVMPAPAEAAPAATGPAVRLRRGLPRVTGGEPWPPTDSATANVPPQTATSAETMSPTEQPPAPAAGATIADVGSNVDAADDTVRTPAGEDSAPLRRGLPRAPGGEPWPPSDAVRPAVGASVPAPVVAAVAEPEPARDAVSAPVAAGTSVAERPAVSAPLPFTRTVWHGTAPRRARPAPPVPEGRRPRPTGPQAISGLFVLAALGILAVMAVALVRWLITTEPVAQFLVRFPGHYDLPEGSQPGFPAWVGWQHFFNVFLMVLIIRSGLRVRTEKRPTSFWTSRRDPKHKISLTLWFHQALDVLWLVNGVVFVVLLFVTGHWVRIVPTSWEVFPNALSAGIQYLSLDWPTENGWANYNGLQQLAYFTTVFIAAPLAAITGYRMSGLWPKRATALSRAYPVEWARALHFPVMLYFVAFITMHVILVMATGALRNINHMYASQDLVSWTGFWVFIASLVVIAIGWLAARPLLIAPVAKVFGNVSGR